MKITLLWPKSTADAELAAVAERYFNRIKHFFPIEIVEIQLHRARAMWLSCAPIRRGC